MQTRKKMTGNKKQRLNSSVDSLTQEFCDIVSDPKKSKTDIQHFLRQHPDFNINTTETLSGARPVHYALQYGSLNSIQFLIEDLNADLTIINYLSNFLLILHKPEIKKYIFEKKLWNKLGDGTTDLHGYAWAGKFDLIVANLTTNPDKISELNNDNKSIFNWAARSIKENLNKWAQRYNDSLNPTDCVRLRNYYICLAYTELSERNFNCAAALFLEAFKQHASIETPTADDSELENKMKRGLSEVYFNQLAVTKDYALYSVKQKECLRLLNSITNKTPDDIEGYIRYCSIIANTHMLRTAALTQNADESLYSDTFAALREYELSKQALIGAQRLVTVFPKDISAEMTANDDLVDLIKDVREQLTREIETLDNKLDFVYSACDVKRPTDEPSEPAADEKMEVEEEEEKTTSLTSPAALRGSMYYASTLDHSITSSNTAQPPPADDNDNDIRALHHR